MLQHFDTLSKNPTGMKFKVNLLKSVSQVWLKQNSAIFVYKSF